MCSEVKKQRMLRIESFFFSASNQAFFHFVACRTLNVCSKVVTVFPLGDELNVRRISTEKNNGQVFVASGSETKFINMKHCL